MRSGFQTFRPGAGDVDQLVGYFPGMHKDLGEIANTAQNGCGTTGLSVIPAEIGGSEVQDCPQLHTEFKAGLGSLKSCLRKQTLKACPQQFLSSSKSPTPKSPTTFPGNATNCGPGACGEPFTFTPHQKREKQILCFIYDNCHHFAFKFKVLFITSYWSLPI